MIQTEELGAGRSGADRTIPGLVVQTGLHELEVGVQRQFALDLQSQDVSSEYIPARGAKMLSKTKHGGQDQDTWMANLHTAVVVVQSVGDGAVGQSGVWNRNLEASAKYGCLRRPAELRYVICNGLADRLGDAGKGGSQTVEGRALRFLRPRPASRRGRLPAQ